MTPDFYTYETAGMALGVHPGTVKRWVLDGAIPCLAIKGTVRIPRTAIEAMVGPHPVAAKRSEKGEAENVNARPAAIVDVNARTARNPRARRSRPDYRAGEMAAILAAARAA